MRMPQVLVQATTKCRPRRTETIIERPSLRLLVWGIDEVVMDACRYW
jgi:hypothetical protein